MRRKVIITGWLVLTGIIVGAILGALTMQILLLLDGFLVDSETRTEAALAGAAFGSVAGGILAPIAAWTLMRSVPLGRAIGETAIGATLGAVVGFFLAPVFILGIVWPIGGALLGFTAAATRLHFAYRGKQRSLPTPADQLLP
jgi:hypothetical protein